MFRIIINALNGANHHTLRLLKMPDALRAAAWMDDIDILALGDGLVRAGRFAHIAVDA
jgi:hypothetical protein